MSLSNPYIQRLFEYIRPQSRPFKRAVFWSICNKVLDLMPPILVAWVIDTVSGQTPAWIVSVIGEHSPFRTAIFLAILAVLIFLFESVFQWAYQSGFMSIAQHVQHSLRCDTYKQLQHREMAFFENHRLGNTLSILNDDTNQLERFLNTGFNAFIQFITLFIFAGTIMVMTSWELALFSLIPVPIVVAGSLVYQRLIAPKYQAIREAVGQLTSRLENNISGILVIKSFTAESFELQRVQDQSDHYRQTNLNAIRYSTIYVPLIRMTIAFGFAGVLLLGSYWILSGTTSLTVGGLVLFSMMIQRLLWPLTQMGVVLDDFERTKASAQRIFELLDTSSSIKDPDTPLPFPSDPLSIRFQDVSFWYDNQVPVLNHCSFDIQPGETIGFVGTTGAGKSTIVKLLWRLYEVTQGQVQINHIPVNQFKTEDLRQHMSLVSQDVYLFHGSIFDNIAYGKDDCSMDDVIQASKQAQFHDFVSTLPDGYHTIVGERGIKLSGGQRQRLSIARAILKNAPIMVFDEATSSVDTETEKAIQQNINTITQGKTAIIIAHRLSTIRHAHRILVLDKGQIKESGTHDELIQHQGLYYDLWSIQTASQQS